MYLIFVCKKNILKTSALIGVIDNKVLLGKNRFI